VTKEPSAAYCRCSTALQPESVETQVGILTSFCERERLEIVAIYPDEDVSGGKPIVERPGFKQLLADAPVKGFKTIVVVSLDRLSRDTLDLLQFERVAKQHGLRVVYATEQFDDTPGGRMYKTIKVAFAQHEREETGQRIKRKNRETCAKGRWPSGRPPLGYSYDVAHKQLGIDADRAGDAENVFRTYLTCNGNFTHTAARLNTMGVRTRDGNLWRDDTVSLVLRNPIYRGRLHYADIDIPVAGIPVVVPTELVAQADVFLRNCKGKRTPVARRCYTYSSMLTCGHCGEGYKVHVITTDRDVGYYCRGRKEAGICVAPRINSSWLDGLVAEGLQRALIAERDAILAMHDPASQSTRRDTSAQLTRLRRAAERYREMYAAGIIESVDELKAKLADVNASIAELDSKPSAVVSLESINQVIDTLSAHWLDSDVTERRHLLLAVSPRITVWACEKRIRLHTTLAAGDIDL